MDWIGLDGKMGSSMCVCLVRDWRQGTAIPSCYVEDVCCCTYIKSLHYTTIILDICSFFLLQEVCVREMI